MIRRSFHNSINHQTSKPIWNFSLILYGGLTLRGRELMSNAQTSERERQKKRKAEGKTSDSERQGRMAAFKSPPSEITLKST